MNLFLFAIVVGVLAVICAGLLIWVGRSILFASTMLHGPVFVPSEEADIEQMIDIAAIQDDERVIDLGSGDGAILAVLGERGIAAHGVELNPLLVREARQRMSQLGLDELITVEQGNFWNVDLRQYDVVFLYGTTYIMEKLEKKLQKEMQPGARLVSNYFQLPNMEPARARGKIRVYEF